jgi:hypothetical protein
MNQLAPTIVEDPESLLALRNSYAAISNFRLCVSLVELLQIAIPKSPDAVLSAKILYEGVGMKVDVLRTLQECIHDNHRAAATLIAAHCRSLCQAFGVIGENMDRLYKAVKEDDERYPIVHEWYSRRFDLILSIFQCGIAEEQLSNGSLERIKTYRKFFRHLFVAINSSTFSSQASPSVLLKIMLAYYHYSEEGSEDISRERQEALGNAITRAIGTKEVAARQLKLNEVSLDVWCCELSFC